MQFLTALFHFAIFLGIVVVVVLGVFYNKLQRGAQNVKEKASNVQIALSKKISEINQLVGMVKNYQEFEQLTQLKISNDSGAVGLSAAYEQSNKTMLAIQATAQRFPDLKANTQYVRLIDSIQSCESNIQRNRMAYNNAVKEYNWACLSVPAVFFSRAIGFPPAPYLEFDISGLAQENSLREFKTDDGERLNAFLGQAGSGLAQAGRNIISRASQFGNNAPAAAKVKTKSASFCAGCSSPVVATDKFCENCGKPTSAPA
jgi:LemA protein